MALESDFCGGDVRPNLPFSPVELDVKESRVSWTVVNNTQRPICPACLALVLLVHGAGRQGELESHPTASVPRENSLLVFRLQGWKGHDLWTDQPLTLTLPHAC